MRVLRVLDAKTPVARQKITVEEALRAYTAAGAYASFEDGEKGVLAAGRLADFVVLDRNLFEVAPEKLRDARVAMTVVGGRVVYRAKP